LSRKEVKDKHNKKALVKEAVTRGPGHQPNVHPAAFGRYSLFNNQRWWVSFEKIEKN
jgi:hypothetical protein